MKNKAGSGAVRNAAVIVTRWLLVWQLAASAVATSAIGYPFFEESYQPDNGLITLQNMLLDPNTSALYVGSVNHLYKLSADLEVEKEIETGPRQDNPGCIAPPVPCRFERTTTDNINKILVIDQDRLFVCGSIYQGICVIRRKTDLGLLSNDSYQVAANTAEGTSVAFIAPGPKGENVLYVATSHANWIDKGVPTISTRVLPAANTGYPLFKILGDWDNFQASQIKIPYDLHTVFNIYYLLGFSNAKFSYFVAVQPVAPQIFKTTFYSKIARICQQDIGYFSYIELPLTCKRGGKDYNVALSAYVATVGSKLALTSGYEMGEKVLFVTFSESVAYRREPTESSAVCMYSIRSIDQQFTNLRKECALGETAETDIPWLRSTQCPTSPVQYLVDQIEAEGTEYCHTQDFIRPLGGTKPIEAEAIYTDESILSAIAATDHLEETVIFLGDHRGHLKRENVLKSLSKFTPLPSELQREGKHICLDLGGVLTVYTDTLQVVEGQNFFDLITSISHQLRVLSATEALLYEEEAILVDEDRPTVRNGIVFIPDKNFIYFMTERKIHKIPVQRCSDHTKCEECLGVGNGVGDPYCGWCSLQNRCTRRSESECSGAEDLSDLRWLRKLDQCIAMISVEPRNTYRGNSPKLSVIIRSLPKLGSNGGNMYKCKFGNLPLQDATVEEISTNTSRVQCFTPPSNTLPAIVNGFLRMELSIRAAETGQDIVSTDFDFFDCSSFSSCMECVSNDYQCDWCIGRNSCELNASPCAPYEIVTKQEGKLACPRIVNDERRILIAAGFSIGFNLSAANLPTPMPGEKGYKCVLEYENRKEKVPARRISESLLECQPKQYIYATEVDEVQANLKLFWSNDFKIDNPDGVSVQLYKCDVGRRDCSRCLSDETTNPVLECRWCSGSTCAFKDDRMCIGSSLDPRDQCPGPTLINVDPGAGPIDGNTVIEITGTNIGRRFQDVVSVMIGGMPCDSAGLGKYYVTGNRVRCATPSVQDATVVQLTIFVTAVDPDGGALESTGAVEFTYKDPSIISFTPAVGPAAGGTLIKITGTDFNAGRDIRATVATNIPCEITSIQDTLIECRTGNSTEGHAGPVWVTFDGAGRSSTGIFTYKANPTVINIKPQKSFQSGGRTLEVVGTGFTAVNRATILVRYDHGSVYNESCTIQSHSFMDCISPAAELPDLLTSSCSNVTLGFMLDGLSLESWSQSSGVGFEYCLDPAFKEFEGNEFVVDTTYSLNITGLRLNLAIDKSEIEIKVGDVSCDIESLTDELISCKLPEKKPLSLDEDGLLTAKVRWYRNHTFTLGKVVYPSPGLQPWVILLITILPVVGIFFVISLTILFVKFNKQKRLLKSYNERLLVRIREMHREIFEAAERQRQEPPTATAGNEQRQLLLQRKEITLNNRINIATDDLKIQFDQLDIGRVLGQGAFGRVHRATLNDSSVQSQRTVAVKTIQDTTDPRNMVKFLEEGLMMKSFRHPNVMGLLGLTFDPEGQPLIVLPFMANGDLKSHIVNHGRELTSKQLVMFAYHVALGMEYLAQQKFVHRDLAARNCMVDEELVAKIADFGLTRDLEESDYYTSGDKQAKLPIKWMAPESMERRVYNTKTDVWSYGVLLWELFSRGCNPYPGLHNRDVYNYLKQGQRMAAPHSCPVVIQEIMQRCWRESPKMRYSFQHIVAQLTTMLATADVDDTPPQGGQGTSAQPDGSEGLEAPGITDSLGYLILTEDASGNESRAMGEPGDEAGDSGGYLAPSVATGVLGGDQQTNELREESEDIDRQSCAIPMEGMASDERKRDKEDAIEEVEEEGITHF